MSAQDITESAKKAWRLSLTSVGYSEWLEGQKLAGKFWSAE